MAGWTQTPDAATLQGFMPDEALTVDQATVALESAAALIEGYTRGNHVHPLTGDHRPGVNTVILTVAARIAANPGQIVARDQAGSFSRHRGQGFSGFTLAELAVLNRYRKRAAG